MGGQWRTPVDRCKDFGYVMDLDPTQATSREALAKYLKQLHLLADKPSYRALEGRTRAAHGLLPGTSLSRIPLKRATITDVLAGTKFPRKAFLLTFVEACGVDLESDHKWEQAWNQLAIQYENQMSGAGAQVEQLVEQLGSAERRADEAERHAEQVAREMEAIAKERDQALKRAEVVRPQRDRGRKVVRAYGEPNEPRKQEADQREDGYAIGIELRPYQFTAVLVNEDGKIIDENTRSLSSMEPEAVVHVLTAEAGEVVTSTLGQGFDMDHVVLGVQLGGPVDTETGTVHFFSKHLPLASDNTSEFRWEDFPLGPRLQQETGFQTVIVNDTVAFAERERWFGVGRQSGDFVVMLVREGVGGAIVSNGQHFKGPVEIGNFRFNSDSVRQSDSGLFGVLELTGGTTGIVESAAELVGRPIADVEAAAAAVGEDGPGRAAAAAFLSAGVAIACGLSYMVQFAGPSHAVLYAPGVMLKSNTRAGRSFLGQVKKFNEAVAFKAFRDCELVLRPTSRTDGAHGAALAARNRRFHASPVQAGRQHRSLR